VRRLLGRGDAFDQTASPTAPGDDALAALRALPGIEAVFDQATLTRLAALAGESGMPVEEVAKQAAIVAAERRNYDPEAARRHLERYLPPARLLVLDTATLDPDAVAGRIAAWF